MAAGIAGLKAKAGKKNNLLEKSSVNEIIETRNPVVENKAANNYAKQQEEQERLEYMNVKEARDKKYALEQELDSLRKETGGTVSIVSSALSNRGKKIETPDRANVDRINALQQEIDSLGRYINRASRIQTNKYLTDRAVNAEDFGRFSFEPEREKKVINPHQQNIERDNSAERFMTEDEKAIYNYYYNKAGEAKAEEYLDSIREDLNYRQAKAIFAGNEDNVLAQLALMAPTQGLEQSKSGFQGAMRMVLLGDDSYQPTGTYDYLGQMAKEDLADKGFKLPEWAGGQSIGQLAYDLINTGANMAPSIAVGALTGTGPLSFGVSAAGNAYKQKINEGYSREQAATYGVIIGVSEATLEKVVGAIGFGGKTLASKAVAKLLPKIDNAAARIAAKYGASMLSEGFEEGLQEVLEPLYRNAAFGENNELEITEDAIYAAILGAVSGGLIEGTPYAMNEINTAINNRKTDKVEPSSEPIKEAQGKPENVVEAVDETVQDDKKVSETSTVEEDLKNLAKEVVEEKTKEISEKEPTASVTNKEGRYVQTISKEGLEEYGSKLPNATEDTGKQVAAMYDPADGISKEAFAKGIDEAYKYGTFNYPIREMDSDSVFAKAIPSEKRHQAYYMGQQNAKAANIKNAKIMQKKVLPGVKGKVVIEDGVNLEKLSEHQKAVIELTDMLSKVNEIEHHVKASYELKKDYFYKNKKGETIKIKAGTRVWEMDGKIVPAENGWMDPNTHQIWYDINAGEQGQGIPEQTVSHEYLHDMRAEAPEKYNELVKIVSEVFERNGKSFSEAVAQKLKQYNDQNINIDEDGAQEEIVAQAMSGMFNDPKTLEEFSKVLYKKNKTLWNEIKDWIAEIIERIKEALKGVEIESEEARMLKAEKDLYEHAQKIYVEGIVEAGENYKNSGAQSSNSQIKEQGAVKYEIREAGNTGMFYVQADRQVITGNNPEIWKKQISGYINEAIRKDQDVTFPTSDGHILLLTGRSAYKLSDNHVASIEEKIRPLMSDKEFALKGRAAVHIDELIQVAKFDRYKEDFDNSHDNDLGEDGFNYFNAFFRDFDGEYYLVKFSAGINGEEETTYGIGKIIKRRFPAGRGSSSDKEALKNGRKPSDTIIYTSYDKSQEVKTAIQIAYEKALKKDAENDVKHSLREYSSEEKKQHIEDAIAYFGTTYNWKEAGYLIPDGRRLDFSGRHEGGPGGYRTVDHREITDALGEDYDNGDYSGGMVQFMSEGNIRISPESGGINLSVEPTKNQYDSLSDYISRNRGEVILDIDDLNGNTISSTEYPKYTHANKVIADIKEYFKEGKLPQGSESMTAQFRFQDRLSNADKNRVEILENKNARLEKELADLEKAYESVQNYARAEGILIGQVEQGRTMAKEMRQKQATFDRKAKGYENAIAKKKEQISAVRQQKNELLAKAKAERAEAVERVRKADRERMEKAIADIKAKEKEKFDTAKAMSDEQKRAIIKKYQTSIKKATEGRHMTAKRAKIRLIVNELNQLLLHPTKERHVPEHMKAMVARALNAVDLSNPKYYETKINNLQDRIVKENNPAIRAELKIKINHYKELEEQATFKVSEIKEAYEAIDKSDDPTIKAGFDPVVAQRIDRVSEEIGNTSFADMSDTQLDAVYDLFKMIKAAINNTNKAFAMAKNESITELGEKAVSDLGAQERKNKLSPAVVQAFSSGVYWNNLKPYYFFRKLGSKVFEDLFGAVRKGEDTWAVDINEASNFAEEIKEKYHYNKWYNQKNSKEFESSAGKKFRLTVPQMMSIYAYSKRKDADKHLYLGGFVFDSLTDVVKKKLGIKVAYKINDANTYNISPETILKIVNSLTQEQREFVDEMQKYLSEVMGEKGNEVSMAMYDIKLFKETNYFPLKSANQYNAEVEQKNQTADQIKLKNAGFTKSRIPGAGNPVVLSEFMDVWANHVNDMSMYHAFTLPIEDINRVLNYKTSMFPNQKSVRGTLENAFGQGALKYFDQFIKDINGNAVSDSRESFGKNITSRFKKAAVAGSLSVAIQQPSSIVRAFAVIDPKYLFGISNIPVVEHKKQWNEIKKYAPIAVIKEMGRFDMGTGVGAVDYIKNEKTLTGWIDDATGAIPAVLDESTWITIWHMVKRETKAKHKDLSVNSDKFLKIAGERFTEVVVRTQVYDSTLSRSANMRSKTMHMNALTSFMAESTTSLNMWEDAFNRKGSGTGYKAKIATSLIVSTLFNSALAAFVYALRDDDEDESYWEKYVQSFVSKSLDGLNPLTYYPILRDIWSAMQGYDIERIDMSLFVKAIEAFNKLSTLVAKDTEDMTEEELKEHKKAIFNSAVDSFGTVLDLFGLPVKNLIRDGKAITKLAKYVSKGDEFETTIYTVKKAAEQGFANTVPKLILNVAGYEKDSKYKMLYDAIKAGETEYADRIKSGYKDEKAYHSAVRSALRENDLRIKEAAEARIEGDTSKYMKIAKEIKADGFNQDDVVAAINNEINEMTKESKEDTSSTAKGFFKDEDYLKAVLKSKDKTDAEIVKKDLITTDVANGKSEDEAEKQFYKDFKDEVKEAFEKGEISAEKAKELLIEHGEQNEQDAFAVVEYWQFKEENPDIYADDAWIDEYYNEVESSGIDITTFVEYRNSVKGITGKDKKARRMEVINSLPISKEQKDALYYAEGWAKSTLHEAPWR